MCVFNSFFFETSSYKCELYQKMLISARKKDETSKLMVHTIATLNEMNVHIFEVQVIDETVRITSLPCYSRNVDFEYSPRNTFPTDLAHRQY